MYYPHTQAKSHHSAKIQARLVVIVLFAAWLGLALNACAKPRTDLPPETPRLTETKRKEYELLFFNEFSMRNAGNGDIAADGKRRYELFQNMANDGYELAAIALKLYDIRHHRLEGRYDEAAHKRLEALAEAGDLGAMCFLYPYLPLPNLTAEKLHRKIQYTQRGAELGHPACAFWLATIYERGVGGMPKNMNLSLEWLLTSARAGDLMAQKGLSVRYQYGEQFGDGFVKDPAKALCWARAAAKSEVGSKYNRMKGNLISIEGDLRRNGLHHLIQAQDERERIAGKACDL